ncbi:MAG TPA: hypothetical protein VKP66_17910 [Steroidobacteraceae bacterium]|nr:hypothetical protein [Steroidobacteraceae bacterium]
MNVDGRWVIAAALICCHGSVSGDESIIDRMRTCATEADEAKRLACYDLQIGRSKVGQNEDLGVTGELLRQKQRQAGVQAAPADDMTGKVVEITNRRMGKSWVTLDNGQVWAQEEVPDFTLRVGDVITVRRGALGALWMVSPSGRDQIRTRRMK